MIKEAPLALTFADVSLVPRKSRVSSRADVSTKALFSRQIELQLPIVAANMDTVTTAPMAIALARLGGIAVIHRFLSAEAEANEVARVKRAGHYRIDLPYTISPEHTVAQAAEMAFEKGVSGFLVVDQTNGRFEPAPGGGHEYLGGKLLGILTTRDMRAAHEPERQTVLELMTPRERLVVAGDEIDLAAAKALMLERRVEKLPLVDHDDCVVGLYTLRDVNLRDQFPLATRDSQGRLRVAAAVGVRGDYLERAQALVEAGVDALVLDIAHGHMEVALRAVEALKSAHPDVDLVAGNVATADGAHDLVAVGADAIKVGVGPGAACETRTVAGTGVPQWSVVNECADVLEGSGVPLISDGGIREAGDVAKAIGAGASTVMIGSLLAGTDESPGAVVKKNGKKYKVFRGMASTSAAAARLALEGRGDALDQYVAEGTEVEFELKGPAADVIRQLVGGLRSGMAYSDSLTVPEFWQKATFVQQTQAGRDEGRPHAHDKV